MNSYRLQMSNSKEYIVKRSDLAQVKIYYSLALLMCELFRDSKFQCIDFHVHSDHLEYYFYSAVKLFDHEISDVETAVHSVVSKAVPIHTF